MPIIIKPEQGKPAAAAAAATSSSSMYGGGSQVHSQVPRDRLCQPANNPVLQHLRQQQLLKSQQQVLPEEPVHSPSYTTANFNPPQVSHFNTSGLQQQESGNSAMFGLDLVATSQQQPLLRRNHIPPPLNPLASSCPSTPLTPLTPNHPQTPQSTPNHPQTPNHVLPQQQQQQNTNNPLTPHTPHTPHTPLQSNFQHQQPQFQQPQQQHHQHAHSLPCTPSHPLTPNHPNTPLTPNPSHHQTRHFHFPPPEPLQDTSTYTQPLHLQQQQQQQQFPQQQQFGGQQFNVEHPQQQGLTDEHMQQQLEALQAEQQIREIQRELQRHCEQKQLQQELQELTESMQQQQLQHPFMDGLDDDLDINMEHSQQNQQSKNAMGTVSITALSTSTSSTQQLNSTQISDSNKSKVVDDMTVQSSKCVASFQERKRRASADPDNFTQPKRDKHDSSSGQDSEQKKVAFWGEKNESTETEKIGESPDKEKSLRDRNSNDDKFVSPEDPAKRGLRGKKKHRPEPLIIPAHVSHYGFHSKLRSPRLWGPSSTQRTPPPYTPPPMLSPVRSGSGLFWSLDSKYGPITPKSAPVFPRSSLVRRPSIPSCLASQATTAGPPLPPPPIEEVEEEEPPPETDIQP